MSTQSNENEIRELVRVKSEAEDCAKRVLMYLDDMITAAKESDVEEANRLLDEVQTRSDYLISILDGDLAPALKDFAHRARMDSSRRSHIDNIIWKPQSAAKLRSSSFVISVLDGSSLAGLATGRG